MVWRQEPEPSVGGWLLYIAAVESARRTALGEGRTDAAICRRQRLSPGLRRSRCNLPPGQSSQSQVFMVSGPYLAPASMYKAVRRASTQHWRKRDGEEGLRG